MKKKAIKKEILKIQGVNDVIIETINAYAEKYNFDNDDKKNIENVEVHLKNMNVLFQQIADN